MERKQTLIRWLRLVLTAALATSVGMALNVTGSHAALEYDPGASGGTAGVGDLTRFEIDGDRVPGVVSNSGITHNPGVDTDWESTPYGPQPIGSDPAQPVPSGIGSTGLLPLLFADIRSDDFPTASASPSRNPAFGLPGEPEFCTPNEEDAWVGGTKVQDVSIDDPLYTVDGAQALQCANVLGKGDLFSAYAAYETVSVPNTFGDPNSGSQNHVIVYGAWERGEVPGELNFYIPIADSVAGNSSGDRLIAFDYNSSAPASYRILAWSGSAWVIETSGTAAVNGSIFAAAVGFADGSPFTAKGNRPSFGEFALDITAAGILPDDSSGECVQLATAGYVFTETGNSASAQLKDYVGAPKIPIGNCGSFSVTKAGPAGVTTSPLFDYRVEQQDSLDMFSAPPPGTTPVSTTNQLNSQFRIGDTQVWADAFAGPDYFAFEAPESITPPAPSALPTGWDMVSVECTYVDGYADGYPIVTETLWTNGARTTDDNGDLRTFQVHSGSFLTLTGHDDFVPNCVITNDASGVVVTKAGNGDAAQSFDFDAGGQTDSLTIGQSTFFSFDAAASVVIAEGGLPAGWELSSIECLNEDGSPNATGVVGARSVDITVGDASNTIECTFTNNQLPVLTLVKSLTNDNGGTALATDWMLTATGPTDFSGRTGVSRPVSIGDYDLSESGPALYTGSEWVCTGGQVDGDTVALTYGDDVTCTITNDDDAPSLTLVKEVINDNGGTAVPSDFTLTAAGYDAGDPQAGTFDLSESGPAGYTQTSLTCDNSTLQVTAVTVGLGDDVTCTFVNDDDAPSLTLVKQVVNDNGGSAVAGDWTLTAAGYDAANPLAGTYALSESGGPVGYTQTSLTCSNAAGQVAEVTLGLGDDVVCTFVNDDTPPGLTLVKEVINDNGGTAVSSDFTLTAAGYDAGDPQAGTFDLSESGPAGYTRTSLACDNSTGQVTSVTLGLNEAVVCTFVNDDDAPSLTLVKQVVNDDGGHAIADDFTLSADGPTPISGAGGATSDATFSAGTYELAESALAGYAAGDWVCVGGLQNAASVMLDVGESAVCTIVNDDEPVDLELTKNDDGIAVIAGGAPFDYTITVQNIGSRDADLDEPVTVTDDLPRGLSWESFPTNCSQTGQTLTCDIDPTLLPAGGTPVVITATVSVDADATSGTYVNKASVTTDDDPVCVGVECVPPPCEQADANNNVDCEQTPVIREGAIQIIKTDDVADGDTVKPGGIYSYELIVTNTGTSTILPGLVVTDDLPTQLDLVSTIGGAGWYCNSIDPIECTYAPALAPGASAPAITVDVEATEDASVTEIVNIAEVIGAVDRDCETDRLIDAFDPACNEVTDNDDETTPLDTNADLAIVKTASVDQIGAGGGFDWVLDVTNHGPGTAINVEIGDLVPPVVNVTGVSSADFDCGNDGNTVTCTVGSLPVGDSGTVTIAVTVPSSADGGVVINVGTVECDTPDPDLTNNSDDASVVIVAQAAPTTTIPVELPKTGSDATSGIVRAAFLLLLIGGVTMLITRRSREDDLDPID